MFFLKKNLIYFSIRAEEINELVKQLKNATKIRDVAKSQQIFEEMVKAYEKCKKVVEKEGHFKQFIRSIAEFETFINELWTDAEWRKSASKNNSTALSKLRQRIRKYNKDYEKEIGEFRANPELFPEEEKIEAARGQDEDEDDGESDEEESESESDDSEEETKVKTTKKKRVKTEDDDDESDSEEWSDSESDETSSGDEIDYNQENVWKNFLKKYN